ncbi:IclR family transcriptional regulator C-terminal domain-containing protein [Propionivibrio sp.]|uniref:IclR family transcriptional regulator domain-containing protein n=1 Tax=Propionivibrio sp. TaxID=2212460 RepID=UPI0026177C93|nr:IclR family transcriptional regulator C-terminal domain-containing protein [Propionivibrio sp.]
MAKKSSPKPAAVPLISAAVRVLAVLERLSQQRAIGLEEISREIKLAKPTVYRFLLTLQELGYARRVDGERWAMTLKMFNLGARALDHLDLLSAARPIAEALSEELGETVHMGVLDGDAAVYILKIESRYTIRMYSRVGRRMPLYCTAIGKILLAFAKDDEREASLKGIRLLAITKNTLTTRAALDAELAQVREQGFARDNEEREDNLHCIGAPIFDYTGAVVAALSVSWPSFRYEPDDESGWIDKVKGAAAAISAVLGHPVCM